MSKFRETKFKKGLKKLALASSAFLMAATISSAQPMITTELNGSRIQFDQPPVMQGGRVLVPLRGIFENLGADVLYNPSNRTIKATGDGQTVELTLGQRQAFINGRQVYLDVPADTIGGRTMVPLRFVSEAMGADVKWQSASRTVAITRSPMSNDIVRDNGNNNQQDVATRPQINQLIHNARGTLNPGDNLTVTMTGDANAQASFSILGSINNVRMNEVSPGRYEGQLRVTPGIDVNNGTLVGYLKKNNLESLKEADRNITISSNSGNNNSTADLSPSPGSTVNQTRPTMMVTFPESVRAGTASMRINGQSYQPSLSYDNRTLSLSPSFNLNPGVHRVDAQALTQDGRLMQREWNFTVSQSAYNNNNNNINNNNNNNNNPTVSISNLSDGSTVPAVFNLQGQTSPYTKVNVNATSQRSLIPGIIGIRGREFRTSTVSDGNGRFDVQLNTAELPANSLLDIEISVLDSSGSVSDTVDLNLTRR